MAEIRYGQWFDATRQLAYPFEDAKAGLELDYAPDDDVFLDARFYPVVLENVDRVFLHSVTVTTSEITLSVRHTASLSFLTATVDRAISDPVIRFYDSNARDSGLLIADVENFNSWSTTLAPDTYTYPAGVLSFVASTLAAVRGGLTGLIVDGTLFSGDIAIVGKDGVHLDTYDGGQSVYVHVLGDPMWRRKSCRAKWADYQLRQPLEELVFLIGEGYESEIHGVVPGTWFQKSADQYGTIHVLVDYVDEVPPYSLQVLRIIAAASGQLRIGPDVKELLAWRK